MKLAFDYFPTVGWHTFTDSEALTDAVWKQFDPSNWHYLNFTSDTSAWESKQDGSVLFVAFTRSSIARVFAERGQAELTFDPIAVRFGLEKSQPLRSPNE